MTNWSKPSTTLSSSNNVRANVGELDQQHPWACTHIDAGSITKISKLLRPMQMSTTGTEEDERMLDQAVTLKDSDEGKYLIAVYNIQVR